MPAMLYLADPKDRDDLATFLGRAGRIEDAGLRLQEVPNGIACWVPVLRPAGLLTDSPLVIGVRGIPGRIESTEANDFDGERIDLVVPLRGMLDRLAREAASELEATRMLLPSERPHESWTGVTPPLSGWEPIGMLSAEVLNQVAEDGIAEVGERVGGGLGQILAEEIRTNTWTRPLPELARLRKAKRDADRANETAHDAAAAAPLPPAGVAFAAHALGFLRSGMPGQLSQAPGWWRIAFPAGNVLVRRR
ncbi:MAG: hypothetical protein ACTHXA_01660 [Gulosibacter sp.]|uniref:hypothetical protein n=1 Tax=Gulosibacter sp. TaxID=2817531 RepID=UPI003F932EB7